MLTPENPPGFIVRTEAQKAAWDDGYRLERGLPTRWPKSKALSALKVLLVLAALAAATGTGAIATHSSDVGVCGVVGPRDPRPPPREGRPEDDSRGRVHRGHNNEAVVLAQRCRSQRSPTHSGVPWMLGFGREKRPQPNLRPTADCAVEPKLLRFPLLVLQHLRSRCVALIDENGLDIGRALAEIEDRELVELPQESVSGRWRLWVPASALAA